MLLKIAGGFWVRVPSAKIIRDMCDMWEKREDQVTFSSGPEILGLGQGTQALSEMGVLRKAEKI